MRNKYYLTAAMGTFIVMALVACPDATFAASTRGLELWWNIVFPAQLPFFVAAELLAALGVVHYLGALLEPLMRSAFRLPGEGGFIMAVSLASGFPMGAILTAKYRDNKAMTRDEGERMLALASTAGPLYMMGAVATGMLGWPEAGPVIVAVHYASCLTAGLFLRFYGRSAAPGRASNREFIFTRAAKALVRARREDERKLGAILSEAVTRGFSSLTMVGGFIICFSVLIELLEATGAVSWLAQAVALPSDAIRLFSAGFLEVTNGCRQVALSAWAMPLKTIAVSAIIAWNGLSIQGQVASLAAGADLSTKPYLLARVIQTALAVAFSVLIIKTGLLPPLPTAAAVWSPSSLGAAYLSSLLRLGTALGCLTALGVTLGLMHSLLHLKVHAFRVR